MYYSSVILSAVVLCLSEVASLKQCSDCMVYNVCPAAMERAQNKRNEETTNLFKKAHCGYEQSYGKSIPKVCCSDFLSLVDEIKTHPNRHLLPNNCGDGLINRIYHGTEARLYELPWMALVSQETTDGLKFTCGGSLINSRYVLTAAHCVYNVHIAGVRLGELDTASKIDCEGSPPTCVKHRDFLITNQSIHPGYIGARMSDDIALLRLKKPVSFTSPHIKPICLPVTKELREMNVYNNNATVAGWGFTESGSISSKLMKVRMRIQTPDECAASAPPSGVIDHTLCAGENQKDSCKGDSGGPMIIGISNGGSTKYVQYGIVSNGPRDCGTRPGIYTDVSKYMKWILDNIAP